MIIRWSQPAHLARALWRTFVFILQGRPVFVPHSTLRHRRRQCFLCPEYRSGWCNLCACNTDAKTLLSSEQCPHTPTRWRALTSARKRN